MSKWQKCIEGPSYFSASPPCTGHTNFPRPTANIIHFDLAKRYFPPIYIEIVRVISEKMRKKATLNLEFRLILLILRPCTDPTNFSKPTASIIYIHSLVRKLLPNVIKILNEGSDIIDQAYLRVKFCFEFDFVHFEIQLSTRNSLERKSCKKFKCVQVNLPGGFLLVSSRILLYGYCNRKIRLPTAVSLSEMVVEP